MLKTGGLWDIMRIGRERPAVARKKLRLFRAFKERPYDAEITIVRQRKFENYSETNTKI